MEYAITHPQMCVDDGDRFWKDYAKKGARYIVAGCDPKMQRKMYKDALAEAGCDFDSQVFPIDLRNMPTEEAMQKIKDLRGRGEQPVGSPLRNGYCRMTESFDTRTQ